MKTMTIRDLRQGRPEAEAALQFEEEIAHNQGFQAVVKLVRVPAGAKMKKLGPEEHARAKKGLWRVDLAERCRAG